MAKGRKTGGRDWKPGESGNPKGGPGYPQDIRDSRKVTQFELERAINALIHMPEGELAALMESPSTTMFEKMIGSIILAGAGKGDQMRLDFILNRMIGKVKDQLEV